MRGKFLLWIACVLMACGNPNAKLIEDAPFISKTYKDDLGRELSFKNPPKKVISLAPSITEMIFAAGAGKHLCGRSEASNYPPEALSLPQVISFPEPDFESFVVLDAELVIATDEVLPIRYLPSFERMHLPVFLQRYDSLGDIWRHLRTLGEMFETQSVAKPLADSLEKAAESIAILTKGEIQYPSFILVSVEPLIVAGGNSYLNELLEKSGGKNIFSALKEKYPKVTAEAILAGNPEYIFVPDGDGAMYSGLIAHYPVLAKMPAAGSGQVFALNPDLILRPGPRLIEGLVMMTRILHPRVNIPFVEDEE